MYLQAPHTGKDLLWRQFGRRLACAAVGWSGTFWQRSFGAYVELAKKIPVSCLDKEAMAKVCFNIAKHMKAHTNLFSELPSTWLLAKAAVVTGATCPIAKLTHLLNTGVLMAPDMGNQTGQSFLKGLSPVPPEESSLEKSKTSKREGTWPRQYSISGVQGNSVLDPAGVAVVLGNHLILK